MTTICPVCKREVEYTLLLRKDQADEIGEEFICYECYKEKFK